jgi:SAM-dependent methyltransferase
LSKPPPGAREQRFIFDEVAALYERARPGYPNQLIDDVVTLSGIEPTGRILEIGAGTGKATVPFASRGFEMVCLEPGAVMAGFARAKVSAFPCVRVFSSTFEDWPLETGAFDLIISAQAFHWVAPDVRFVKSAAALRHGGALAIFGNSVLRRPSPLRDALDAAYQRHAPELGRTPLASWYADAESVMKSFDESGRFQPVRWLKYPWSIEYTTEAYVGLLQTHSDHQVLAPGRLGPLLAAVGQVLKAHGGTINIAYETHLYVARRKP